MVYRFELATAHQASVLPCACASGAKPINQMALYTHAVFPMYSYTLLHELVVKLAVSVLRLCRQKQIIYLYKHCFVVREVQPGHSGHFFKSRVTRDLT